MRKRLIVISLLSFFYGLQGTCTYVYPVTSFVDKKGQCVVLMLQQKGLSDLSLWFYNTQTGATVKELYWHFIPAGIAFLPDGEGFSFVDSGRLRIKLFTQRSPKSVEFPVPIHALGNVRWSDKDTCYFSAKSSQQRFEIFFAKPRTHDPQIATVCKQQKKDYLHPTVQQKTLFCIERSLDHSTTIVKKELYTAQEAPVVPVVATGYQQICYLEMIDANRGWYIEHMPYLDKQLKMVSFIVHYFFQEESSWQEQTLFSFNLPFQFLFGDQRLYESFLAIRPRFYNEAFYYCDAEESTHLLPKKYLLSAGFGFPPSRERRTCACERLSLSNPNLPILSLLPTATGLYGGFFVEGDTTLTDVVPLLGVT